MVRFRQLDEVLSGDPRHQLIGLCESDADLFWRLTPNVRLGSTERPFFDLISNAEGLREDHEIRRPKPAKQIRILFLGDSCTFGYLLPPESTVVEQVEVLLHSRFPSADIECINAGVPGYTLFQGYRYLESSGAGYAPDLVVVNFGWNDAAEWDGRSDLEVHRELQRIQPPTGLAWSRLAKLVWSLRWRPAAAERESPARPRLTPAEFASVLRQLHATTSRIGAELLVLIGGSRGNIPATGHIMPTSDYQIQQLKFGESIRFGPDGGPAYVEGDIVAAELSLTHPIDEIFFDDAHPTALTNHEIAKEIVRKIEPWLRQRLPR